MDLKAISKQIDDRQTMFKRSYPTQAKFSKSAGTTTHSC